jgi:hypothetical protein
MVGKLQPGAVAAVEGCLSRKFPITGYAASFQTTQSSGGPNYRGHLPSWEKLAGCLWSRTFTRLLDRRLDSPNPALSQ